MQLAIDELYTILLSDSIILYYIIYYIFDTYRRVNLKYTSPVSFDATQSIHLNILFHVWK